MGSGLTLPEGEVEEQKESDGGKGEKRGERGETGLAGWIIKQFGEVRQNEG